MADNEHLSDEGSRSGARPMPKRSRAHATHMESRCQSKTPLASALEVGLQVDKAGVESHPHLPISLHTPPLETSKPHLLPPEGQCLTVQAEHLSLHPSRKSAIFPSASSILVSEVCLRNKGKGLSLVKASVPPRSSLVSSMFPQLRTLVTCPL